MYFIIMKIIGQYSRLVSHNHASKVLVFYPYPIIFIKIVKYIATEPIWGPNMFLQVEAADVKKNHIFGI